MKKPMYKIAIATRNTARNIIVLSRVSLVDVVLILKAGIDTVTPTHMTCPSILPLFQPINDKFIVAESITSGTKICQNKINIDEDNIFIENDVVFINNIPECKFSDLHFANSKDELKSLIEGILLPDRYIEEKEFLDFKNAIQKKIEGAD